MTRRSLFGRPPAPPPPVPPPPTEPRIETAPAARPGSSESPLSIREISARVREVLEDGFPRSFWIEGELSRVSPPRSGHLYLSFREERVVLEAVAWATDAQSFVFTPEPGDRVRAFGRLRTYDGRSRYQFQVQRLEKAGAGALLQELAEREARFEREGLFDPGKKRDLPFLPLRIGLLTAARSDASVDFLKAAHARFPGVRIRQHHAPVQGPAAPAALAAGIRDLGRRGLDVIVVTRGGGSVEDLLPFSDERVVRAAAACPAPLVSAIGHERDRPLLDRVADHRASTPSAAARDILPLRSDLVREVEARREAAAAAARRVLRAAERRLVTFRTHRAMTALPAWLERERRSRQHHRSAALEAARSVIEAHETRLRAARERLDRNHPARRLAQQASHLGHLRERLVGLPLLRGPAARLEASRRRVSQESLYRLLETERAILMQRRAQHRAAVARLLERRSFTSETVGRKLEDLDPRIVLRRGYSLALDGAGRAVASSREVEVGDRLRLLLAEGELGAAVEEVRPPPDPVDDRSAGRGPAGNQE
jgi:exodeoxyribonuclease VII large subunit